LAVAKINDLIARRAKERRRALADGGHPTGPHVSDQNLLLRAGGIARRVGNIAGLVFSLPAHVND
jgi:hypothetical protein